MKNVFFSIVLVFIFLIGFFLIGEIAFRLAKGKPNPLYEITQKDSRYLFLPNTTLHRSSSIAGEFDYDVRINGFGYRGKEFNLEKTPGVNRILTVGDSFTFGVGVEDHQTIPFVLEEILKSKGHTVEIINGGIGHASPITHFVNFRDIHLQYNPDVVVLFLDMTDLWDDWHSERNAVYNRQGEIDNFDVTYINGKKSYWVTLMNYSVFCRWIDKKIVRSFKKIQVLGFKQYFKIALQGKRAKGEIATSKAVEEDKKIEYDGLLFMRGRAEEDLIKKHWPRTAGYISKIHNICRQKNIPFVLVMYPHGIYVGEKQWHEGRLTWGFEQNKQYTDYFPFELASQYAQQEGIPFINALDGFLTAPQDQKYFFDWDGHMTEKGYELVAEAVAENPEFVNILNQKK